MSMYSYSQNRHADPADISANLEQRLNDLQVKAARARAQSATNGQGSSDCVDCDSAIDPKRKELIPASTRCASCQQEYEEISGIPGYGHE